MKIRDLNLKLVNDDFKFGGIEKCLKFMVYVCWTRDLIIKWSLQFIKFVLLYFTHRLIFLFKIMVILLKEMRLSPLNKRIFV